jgi:outer membrane protein OmpA-like peptidoglycan-associated protein
MNALQVVLNEMECRLGIRRPKAVALLSGFLKVIQAQTGGIEEFRSRFRLEAMRYPAQQSGQGWTIAATNIERVLGTDKIEQLASRAGLSTATAGRALALVVSRMVPGLTAERVSSTPVNHLGSGNRQASDTDTRQFRILLTALCLAGLSAAWYTSAYEHRAKRRSAQNETSTMLAESSRYKPEELIALLNLEPIEFLEGSTRIPSGSYDFLNRVATAIENSSPQNVIQIRGYADGSGNEADGSKIAEARAKAVYNHLVALGVESRMMSVAGDDGRRSSPEEAQNGTRRIQFTFAGPYFGQNSASN